MTADVSGHKENSSSSPAPFKQATSSSFSAASLSIRAQKKIASKLSTRNVTKLFLNDSADRLFDQLYSILNQYYSKKESEKVVKNMIKLAVKLGLLSRNNLLSRDDEKQLLEVQQKMRGLALTLISFSQVEYSYERAFFLDKLNSLKNSLSPLVVLNLSDKSSKRLDHVFSHLCNTDMLDALFKVNGPHSQLLKDLTKNLISLIDANQI